MEENPYAAPSAPTRAVGRSTPGAVAIEPGELYAGFWRRFGALAIDGIILYATIALLGVLLAVSGSRKVGAPVAFVLVVVGLFWFYWSLFESSSLQATPGKLALGIKVTDLQGRRLGFWRATGRHFCRFVSGLPLYVGYMAAGFSRRRQTFHDMIVGALVVKRRYDQEQIAEANVDARPASGALVAIVVVFALIAVTGILAAIAIPAYQDYTVRAQVAEAMQMAGPYKEAVDRALAAGREAKELGSDTEASLKEQSGRYVESASVKFGIVVLRFGNRANRTIAGKELLFYPVLSAARNEFEWLCGHQAVPEGYAPMISGAGELGRYTTLPDKYLPRTCRAAP